MAPDLVADRVRKVAAEALDEATATVTAETPFGAVGGLDSLDCVEVVMALEEEFRIDIPDDVEAAEWKTVGDAIAYIKTRVPA